MIDTGDHVRHGPTGEDWIVACVIGDKLSWCGWPEGMADIADCTLTRKATDEERDKLLHDLARINTDDHRCRYAQRRLTDTQRPTLAQRPNEQRKTDRGQKHA